MPAGDGIRPARALFAALALVALLVSACGVNRELVGSWKLVETGDTVFVTGMFFEFREDRSLLITPGAASLSEAEREAYQTSYGESDITYTASPDGSLNLILHKGDGRRVTVRMTYELLEDHLEIQDEEGVTLVFHRP